MKHFFCIMAMLAIAISTTFCLTACGDDDDPTDQPQPVQHSIVGSWQIASMEIGGKVYDEDNSDPSNFWNFMNDGIGEYGTIVPVEGSLDEMWAEDNGYTPFIYNKAIYGSILFDWTQTGSKITMKGRAYRVWQDDTYKRVGLEEPTDVNLTYQLEFLDNNTIKLTEVETSVKEQNLVKYTLRRKSSSAPSKVGYNTNLTQFIPAEMLDKLVQYLPIYEGTSVGNVEGCYLYVPTVVVDETNSYKKGDAMAREILRLSSQSGSHSITVEKKYRSGEVSKSTQALLLGSGNNFTIVFVDEGQQSGIHFKTANIISGIKTSEGLKKLYEALIMLENDDATGTKILPVGKCRVFQGWGDVSTNIDWDANVWGSN